MLADLFKQAFTDYDFAHLYLHIAIYFFVFLVPVVACSIDLGSGIMAAKRIGEPLQSHRFRKTIEKIVVYWLFAILAFVAELFGTIFPQYSLPFIGIVFALAVLCIEGKSVVENARKMKHGLADVPGTIKGFTAIFSEADIKKILTDAAKDKLKEQLTNNG